MDIPEGVEGQEGVAQLLGPELHGLRHVDVVEVGEGGHDGGQDLLLREVGLHGAADVAQLRAGVQHPAAGLLRELAVPLAVEDHGDRGLGDPGPAGSLLF